MYKFLVQRYVFFFYYYECILIFILELEVFQVFFMFDSKDFKILVRFIFEEKLVFKVEYSVLGFYQVDEWLDWRGINRRERNEINDGR